jgi:hypothetical protein
MVGKIIQMIFTGFTLLIAFTVMNSILQQTKKELGVDTTTGVLAETTSIPDISNPTFSIVLLVTILLVVLVVAFIVWKRKGKLK